ncbi:hypothetical protein VPH35_021960 [Triticum aestivum]
MVSCAKCCYRCCPTIPNEMCNQATARYVLFLGRVKKHSTRVYRGRRRHRHGRLKGIARSLQEVQQRGPSDHGGTSAAGPPRAASPPPSACPACASFLPGVDRSHGERPEEQGRSAPASSPARLHVMGITSDVHDFASTGDKDS